jgi:hypothetical protein
VLALVENFQAPPTASFRSEPSPAPAVQSITSVANGNGHPVETESAIAVTEEEPPAPAPEAIESLVRPLIESTPPPPVPVQALPDVDPSANKPEEARAPDALAEALELQASIVLDSIALQNEAKQSAIREIVESFQQQSRQSMLPAAPDVVTAPAPPSLQWIRAPRPRILPIPPAEESLAATMTGPQTPPLAGPRVPQELRNLVEQQSEGGHAGSRKKKSGFPTWTMSLVVATVVFLGIGSLLQYMSSSRDAKAEAAVTQRSDPSAAATPADPPTSKLVEVTGLRLVAPASNQRPLLEYIVVNHTSTTLTGIGLRVTVRSGASGPGSAPLFSFFIAIGTLGPYQSKEYRTELDPSLRASQLPEWQDLRADVRVGLQP